MIRHRTFTVTADNSSGFLVAGSLSPMITISDPAGATNTVFDTATVAGITGSAYAINATPGTSFSPGTIATFTDGLSGTPTAIINWGDNTTSTGSLSETAGTYSVTISGTKTYSSAGQFPITVTITGGGATTQVTSSAYVSTITATAPIAEVMGSSFTGQLLATFTDGSATSPIGYSASINWGDGNVTDGTVAYDTTDGYFTVTGGNTYGGYGAFNPIITFTDPNGGTRTITTSATVAPLHTPTLSLTSATDTSATFAWADAYSTSDGLTKIDLEIKNPDGNFYTIDSSASPSATSGDITISTLGAGVTYQFMLCVLAPGLAQDSTPVTFTTPATSDSVDYDLAAPGIISAAWSSHLVVHFSTSLDISYNGHYDAAYEVNAVAFPVDDTYQIGNVMATNTNDAAITVDSGGGYDITMSDTGGYSLPTGGTYTVELFIQSSDGTHSSPVSTTTVGADPDGSGTRPTAPSGLSVSYDSESGDFSASLTESDTGDSFDLYYVNPGQAPVYIGSSDTTTISGTT